MGDRWRLSQILVAQVVAALAARDPIAARAAAEEGRDLADAIGDRFDARRCRWYLAVAQVYQGDLAGAVAQFAAVADEAEAAHDEIWRVDSLVGLGVALAYQGDTAAARAAADAAVEATAELGGLKAAAAYHVLAVAALAAGDATTAQDATKAGWPLLSAVPQTTGLQRVLSAETALAGGDLVAARRWADDAVSTKTIAFLSDPLTTRARVAIAQGEPDQAERDAHEALARAAEVEAYLFIPDILECLGMLAGEAGSHREAARLFGAAEAIRQRMGAARFKIYDAGYEASVAALRDALGDQDFDAAWAEGAALSTEEAIAYAQRGPRRTQTTRQRLGLTHADRARRRASGQRRPGQQRHRHTAVRLTAHRANSPHPRLRQARPDLPRAARPRSSPPRLKAASVARQLNRHVEVRA